MNIPWNKIEKTDTCWNWIGHIRQGGYGEIMVDGKKYRAHRLIYELLVGKIPDGLQIDHLCRNRKCVNPRHLEPVSQTVNIRRGYGVAAIFSRRTTCSKGHPFQGFMLKRSSCKFPHRLCKICKSESQARYKKNRRRLSLSSAIINQIT